MKARAAITINTAPSFSPGFWVAMSPLLSAYSASHVVDFGPLRCLSAKAPDLNGRAPSVDSEFCALNKTRTIRRQKDDGLRNLIGRSGAACRRLSGHLFESLSHGLGTFRSRRSRAHCIDADTARAIFSRPGFGQQIDGCFARAIETHAGRPVVGNHRRYIDDCSFTSLRHQWSKFRDKEVRSLDVERIHAVKHFFRRFMRRAEREGPRTVDQNIHMTSSELDRSSRHFARVRRVSKVGRYNIRFAPCCADFPNRLLATFRIAPYDDDMNSKLGQLIGCRPANTARSSCNESCQRFDRHLKCPSFRFSCNYSKV